MSFYVLLQLSQTVISSFNLKLFEFFFIFYCFLFQNKSTVTNLMVGLGELFEDVGATILLGKSFSFKHSQLIVNFSDEVT